MTQSPVAMKMNLQLGTWTRLVAELSETIWATWLRAMKAIMDGQLLSARR